MMDSQQPASSSAPPAHTGPERRRNRRRLVQAQARLTILDGPGANTTHAITTRNLSLGGICFLLRESLAVGQNCRIDLQENGADEKSYLCEIIRSRPLSNGKHEMAVQFRQTLD